MWINCVANDSYFEHVTDEQIVIEALNKVLKKSEEEEGGKKNPKKQVIYCVPPGA